MHTFMLLIQIFLILFGVMLLVMGFHIMYSERIIKKHIKIFSGKVIANEENNPLVEYVNDKNETVKKRSTVGSGIKTTLGQKIDVYEYKDKIFFDQKQELMLAKAGMLLFGTILVIAGIWIGM